MKKIILLTILIGCACFLGINNASALDACVFKDGHFYGIDGKINKNSEKLIKECKGYHKPNVTWDNIADRFLQLAKMDNVNMTKNGSGINISFVSSSLGSYTMDIKYDAASRTISYTNPKREGDNNKKMDYAQIDFIFLHNFLASLFDTYKIPSASYANIFLAQTDDETGISVENGEKITVSDDTMSTTMYEMNSFSIDLNKFEKYDAFMIGFMTDEEYNDFDDNINAWHMAIKLYKQMDVTNPSNTVLDEEKAKELQSKISDIVASGFLAFEDDENSTDNSASSNNQNTSNNQSISNNIVKTSANPKTGLDLPFTALIIILLGSFISLGYLKRRNLFKKI